jgi:hypothetical protein
MEADMNTQTPHTQESLLSFYICSADSIGSIFDESREGTQCPL